MDGCIGVGALHCTEHGSGRFFLLRSLVLCCIALAVALDMQFLVDIGACVVGVGFDG
jgi:hypothetical protein